MENQENEQQQITTRRCNWCFLVKPEKDFVTRVSRKCRVCTYKANREYQIRNKDKINAQDRERRRKRKLAKQMHLYTNRTNLKADKDIKEYVSLELPITQLWKDCGGDRALFTIQAKKLLKYQVALHKEQANAIRQNIDPYVEYEQ